MKPAKPKGSKPMPAPEAAKPEPDHQKVIDPQMLEDIGGLIEDPVAWFHAPNVIFELRAPIELLGTPEEARIRQRIEAAKLGIFT